MEGVISLPSGVAHSIILLHTILQLAQASIFLFSVWLQLFILFYFIKRLPHQLCLPDTGVWITHVSIQVQFLAARAKPCQNDFGGRARWGATFGGYASADGNGHGTHGAWVLSLRSFNLLTAILDGLEEVLLALNLALRKQQILLRWRYSAMQGEGDTLVLWILNLTSM